MRKVALLIMCLLFTRNPVLFAQDTMTAAKAREFNRAPVEALVQNQTYTLTKSPDRKGLSKPFLIHTALLVGTTVAQVELSRRIPNEWLYGRYPSRAKMYGINIGIDSALTFWSYKRKSRSGRCSPQDVKSYSNAGLVITEDVVYMVKGSNR